MTFDNVSLEIRVILDSKYSSYVVVNIVVNNARDILIGENSYLKFVGYSIYSRELTVIRHDTSAWQGKTAGVIMVKRTTL